MKHLRIFGSESSFKSEKRSIAKPWVVYTQDTELIHYSDMDYPHIGDIVVYNSTNNTHDFVSCEEFS